MDRSRAGCGYCSATVYLTVTPQTSGVIDNSAIVSGDYPDPSPGNNSVSTATTVLPLPLLSIRVVPTNRVRVQWPTALTNYALQSRDNLGSAGSWSNVSSAPIVIGNDYAVTETNTGPPRFYRLKR